MRRVPPYVLLVRIPRPLATALKAHADQRGEPQSTIVRELLRRELTARAPESDRHVNS